MLSQPADGRGAAWMGLCLNYKGYRKDPYGVLYMDVYMCVPTLYIWLCGRLRGYDQGVVLHYCF